MQDVPILASYERGPACFVDPLKHAIDAIRSILVGKVHAGLQVAQEAAGENRDVDKRCPIASDRLMQHKVKRAFAVDAAARELVILGSLQERITYTLAGAV